MAVWCVLTCHADVCLATLGGSSGAPGHALAPVILGAEQLLYLLSRDFDAGFSHHQTCRRTHQALVTSSVSQWKIEPWNDKGVTYSGSTGSHDTQRRVKAEVYLSFNSDMLLCPLKRYRARAVLWNHLSESIEAGDNRTISAASYNLISPSTFTPDLK